ncbi:MAG: lytic transglycosylase domain-containing protein [Chitinophagaceae bacterium]
MKKLKKLLLFTIFGFGHSKISTAQSIPATETISLSADTSQKLDIQNRDVLPDTKKAIDNNPAINFKDLFESDGLGLKIGAGPRLNPRAVSFVKDYIEKNDKMLTKMSDWGRPFFNMMDGILIQHNLPRELKYLAVIESKLNPVSVSWAGAVGPWQFMPSTAIRMGLKVSRYTDERTHFLKSTQAAAKYLTQLYSQFGDWLLVIAAYNGGPGNVLKAIRRSGSRNFWDIQYYLPTESRNHVKKFIGTHYVFEGQGGLTTLTRAEANDHYGAKGIYVLNRKLDKTEAANAKEQTISGKYNSLVIAKNVIMDIIEFNRYNPDFDKIMASAKNTYDLKLPADKMELFIAHKYQILNESIQLMLSGANVVNEVSYKNEDAKFQKRTL